MMMLKLLNLMITLLMSKMIEGSTFKFEENITPISFNSKFNENIKESDVRVMINKLKDYTAVGFDGVSVRTLKLVIKSIISLLTYIYNLSIKNGIFPEKLKLAIIKPIYINGDKTCINNSSNSNS